MRNYEGYQMEEEDMDARVVIYHCQDGGITKRYCQMVTTRPDWTTDLLTGMTESLPDRERPGKIGRRPDKIGGTGPVTTPLNIEMGQMRWMVPPPNIP